MPFPARKIGDVRIAAIGFGAMGLSAFYGNRLPDEDSIDLIKKACQLAGDQTLMIDTADMYGHQMGDNEKLLSNVLKDPAYRKQIYIATKFGNHFTNQTDWAIRGSKEYVRSAIEKSLDRLGVDYIDLYYQHRVDRQTPIEETWSELKKLKEEGKVKALGISEALPEEIRKAHAITPITAYQVELSPWTPDIRNNGILSTCRELGITVVAYSPLGRGFLTGQFKTADDLEEGDWRKTNPRFKGEAFAQNFKIVEELKAQADEKGCTPGQLSLAWVLAQGEDIIPIPGTKKEKYLVENMEAANIKFSAEEVKAIDDIVEKASIVGDRYEVSGLGAFD